MLSSPFSFLVFILLAPQCILTRIYDSHDYCYGSKGEFSEGLDLKITEPTIHLIGRQQTKFTKTTVIGIVCLT
jgi:hypothetical protein